jgi:uncharacterized protein YbaP (TraB family)
MNRTSSACIRLSVVLSILLAPALAGAQDKHCLWKVVSPVNTVYLLGSIHLMKPEHYPLDPALDAAYAQSRHVVTEVDLDSLRLKEVLQTVTAAGMYTDGTSLPEHISSETYGMIRKTAEKLGFNPQVLHLFRPWLTSVTLVTLHLQTLGFSPDYGIDQYFYRKAKADNKGRSALETIGFQTDLLASMPDTMQEDMLRQTMEDMDLIAQLFDDVYTAWKTGDGEGMDRLLSESYAEYPEIYERLFLARNRAWVPRIEQYLGKSEPCLIIVGAGHLIGEEGVVALLRARGYRVEQL